MRAGFKRILVPEDAVVRTTIDSSVEEFAETEHYAERRFAGPADFLAAFETPWVLELHDVLRELLTPERRVLSIGSGLGEHEVRLFLAGYDVVASDIVPHVLDQAVALFPAFRAIHFDIFHPDLDQRFDDVLVTGLGYACDSRRMAALFQNVMRILGSDGRLIFVSRYQDNPATVLIDRVLWPLEASYRLTRARRRGEPVKLVRRHYGYRWGRRETLELAEAAGFELGRVRHSGFGVELGHIDLDWKFPRAYAFVRAFDRRLRLLNNATTFELLGPAALGV